MVHNLILLYPQDEEIFLNNGLGSLNEAISCTIVEEANGSFELEMEYPVSGRRYNDLKVRNIIYTKPNPIDGPQAFRIYQIEKNMNGTYKYYARHISYDLSGFAVIPYSASNCLAAINGLNTHICANKRLPFSFTTDISKSAEFEFTVPTSVRALLGGNEDSILEIYGGEYKFDNFHVNLMSRRGSDRGVTIRYGKNLMDYSEQDDSSSIYTDILPYCYYDDDNRLETLPEYLYSLNTGYDFVNVCYLDLTSDFPEGSTEGELRQKAKEYAEANVLTAPTVSMDVSFAMLEQSEEYENLAVLERIELFDTVSVIYPERNLSVKAKVNRTEYNAITGRYDSITLGDFTNNLATELISQSDRIKQQDVDTRSFLAKSVARATQWITNGRGYIVAVKNENDEWMEICSLDTPNIATATNVWRWNNGGFGFSSHGYDGPYETAITADGHIVASFIDTGILTANVIQTGILQSYDDNNSFYLDLISGVLRMKASELTILGRSVDDIADEKAKTESKAAVDRMTQTEVFNKLTNKGKNPGIFFRNNELYINATYLVTGILKDKTGKVFELDLDNGTLNMNATSLTISGKTVNSIANDEAKSEASKAVNNMTQDDVFDKLTNKGKNKGLYITNGELYINATYLVTGILKDKTGRKFSLNLETGELTMDASSISIGGISVAAIAEDYATKKAQLAEKNAIAKADAVQTNLNSFINGKYANDFSQVQIQVDKKSETWNQATDPASAWTTNDIKSEHVGDLWYDTTNQKTKIYTSNYTWSVIKSDIPTAVSDLITKKGQIFVSQPKPPYAVGDLWYSGTSSPVKVCTRARETGNYNSGDWVKYDQYISIADANNAAKQAVKEQTQTDIFNKLTNNGAVQGLFLENGKVYLNLEYAKSHYLNADFIKGGTLTLGGNSNINGWLKILDANGNQIGKWAQSGLTANVGTFEGTVSSGTIKSSTISGNTITGGTISGTTISGSTLTSISGLEEITIKNSEMSMKTNGDASITAGSIKPFHTPWSDSTSSTIVEYAKAPGILIEANYVFRVTVGGSGKIGVYRDKTNIVGMAKTTALTSDTPIMTVSSTPNYAEKVLYSYSATSPILSDIGEGTIDENGECYVEIDDTFADMITEIEEYQVFLQKEGPGDLWISKKEMSYFVVEGTENLRFSWEIKAKKRNYESERMSDIPIIPNELTDTEINYLEEIETMNEDTTIEDEYMTEIEELLREDEEIDYT